MEPLLLPAAVGRPRATDMRTVMDAILYMAQGGIFSDGGHVVLQVSPWQSKFIIPCELSGG